MRNLRRDSNRSAMFPRFARPPDEGSIKVTLEWFEAVA
jgi:hypothetical protein